MCEKLSRRLAEKDLAAGGVVLKLKTARFALRTRHARLPAPTVLPDTLFAAARPLLAREADGTAFRLIGIGAQPLLPAALRRPWRPGRPGSAAPGGALAGDGGAAGALRRGRGGAGARVAGPLGGSRPASPVRSVAT